MNKENKSLSRSSRIPTWEIVVIVLVLATALGATFRGSMKSFPDVSTSDPYDIRPERSLAGPMNRVETGL